MDGGARSVIFVTMDIALVLWQRAVANPARLCHPKLTLLSVKGNLLAAGSAQVLVFEFTITEYS